MKQFRSFLARRKSRTQDKAQKPIQPQAPSQTQALSEPSPPESAPVPAAAPIQHEDTVKAAVHIQAVPGTLNIALRNDTTSSTVYAYITGQAIDRNNALFLLQADAHTAYYPSNPPSILQPLQANCAIPLGAPGHTVTAQIPHIAGGRIWFSINAPLTFKLNPGGAGPALVEPSVTNPSDPNATINWTFAEFTFNADQLYANISYVDFVSIPISLTLDTINSGTQHVSGMPTTGLQQIVDGLRAQHAKDNQPWDKLIINHPGTNTPLRVLSPNQGMVLNGSIFAGYFDPYTNAVLKKYANTSLAIDTQAGFGTVHSTPVQNATSITINGQVFARPSTADIFSCSTGPFATGQNAERNAIIPRLAAAFNRSTLLLTSAIPAAQNLYYQEAVTNHYSRVVHGANLDGKGYAFPYDDVAPAGGADVSGEVHAGDPRLWTVAVGGGQAGK